MNTSSRLPEETTQSIPLTSWVEPPPLKTQQNAISALEHGGILYMQKLSFHLDDAEKQFLSSAYLKRSSKNISQDPHSGKVSGTSCSEQEYLDLTQMMTRFATHALSLVRNLFPRYAGAVVLGRTSFRPAEIEGRSTSRRMDDTLLHIDAFPSRPTHGWRILRIFSNVNHLGQDRVWYAGQPFEEVAETFLDRIPRPQFGSARILTLLGITKTSRTLYDHFMLKMHDAMKESTEYQSSIKHTRIAFPPGSTWIAFTDQVSHAAISGQHVLEQTFNLPVAAMADEMCSPLRILEKMKRRSLV